MYLQGSGITIFSYRTAIGTNASLTIDGNHTLTQTLPGAPAPNYAIANFSMFDVQQLPAGFHTASLTLNDLYGEASFMVWDYAYVNETQYIPPQNTTLASTTSSSAPSSLSSASQCVSHVCTKIHLSLRQS